MCDGRESMSCEWAQKDSNLRPTGYEPGALTTELWALAERIIPQVFPLGKREFHSFHTHHTKIGAGGDRTICLPSSAKDYPQNRAALDALGEYGQTWRYCSLCFSEEEQNT
jgi:hypothetical protein